MSAKSVKELLQKLSEDNLSSTTQITAYTCEALKSILPSLPPHQVRSLLRRIPSYQPSMAPLYVLCDFLLDRLKKGEDGKTLGETARCFLRELAEHVQAVTHKTAGQIQNKAKIVTYSSSAIVMETLMKAKNMGKQFTLYISEARPVLEGIEAAKKTAGFGIPTVLTTDVALFNQLELATLVLIGADALSSSNLIHKMGTRALVQAAVHEKVPVWVVGTPEKKLNASQITRFKILNQSPKEITTAKTKNLNVENRYFDITPLRWINKVILN